MAVWRAGFGTRARGSPGCEIARSMAQEVDPVELIAETDARLDRGAEVRLAEHISIEPIFGHHGRVARLTGDQRPLAEEIAGAQVRDIVTFAHDLDGAVRNQKELFTRLALTHDDVAGNELALGHLFRDVGEFCRSEVLECINGFQELANPHRVM